ncbi:MAG: hypothetical protein ABF959_12740 [Gluconobacter albidus]|uniref:Uncharacterized protein n=1 Tax=Gluconobacter albidus TaxID=318683 RepID=A0A149TMA0_9PROT|nr:hypothetical protein [Gluconobacter albidus]KXV50134.1 hypothetical protein AD945_02710 [Gluconobacter albidus]
MATPTNTARSKGAHLLSRALLNIRANAQSVLGSSEALSPEHRRVLSAIKAAADAVHNLPHLLAEQTESNEVALIGEVTTAKEAMTTLKMG